MSKIFPDSKTFVDMKLKQTPEKTLEYFKKWKVDYPNRTKEEVEIFVNVSLNNFYEIRTGPNQLRNSFVDNLLSKYIRT